MSELSPPVILVRAMLPENPDRVTVCVEVVRMGSLHRVVLGDFGMIFMKRGDAWQLASVDTGTKCPARPVLAPEHGKLEDAAQDPQ
jgi:hypothetical protein